ncbi:MAG TPA: hypothetical protein VEC14_10190, partial [Reyranellaceae bacterium]|nr:hypothetical protein [Reyranellaceae bacterium]
MKPLPLLLAPLSALLVGAAEPVPSADPAAVERVRGHVAFLASDHLQGRDTGSPGYAIAADYVVRELAALGVQPAGTGGGWYQSVPFRRATHAVPPTITYTAGGRATALVSGRDVGLRPSITERDRRIDAPLIFVGRGVSEPRLGIDDYAGLDVRGKIVVALSGSPPGIASDVAAHLYSFKDETAAAKGAAGYLEIEANGGRRGGVGRGGRPLVDWVGPAGRVASASGLVRSSLALSPEWAARIFEGAPKSLEQLRADAAAGRPIRGFELPGRMSIAARSDWQDFRSPNVVGVIPGSDPRLAAEHIVLMGH